MRTLLATSSVTLLLLTPIVFASQLRLPVQSASPGSSVVVPVIFAAQTSSVSGVQFDIQYDNSAMSVAVTVGDSPRTAGKNYFEANLAPNKKRILFVGLNQNPIPDGTLLNLLVNLNDEVPNGTYALQLFNVCATDPFGRSVPITSSDGAITTQASGPGAPLQLSGILNAGSFLPGPVALGELITLIGSGIGPTTPQQAMGGANTSLGGTSVLFDGISAPILFAGPNQINAVVPYALSGKSSIQLEITGQGHPTAGGSLTVTAAAPAIFTLNSSGIGPGAILNQDSSVNSPSNPAAKGSVVAFFATGAGQTDPPGIDGQITATVLPKPLLPVSVQVDGLDAKVIYAGAAPGLIAGAVQVNVAVPPAAHSGPSIPIVLTLGTASSQAGVTLAIE